MRHVFDVPFLFDQIRGLVCGDYYAPVQKILDLQPGDRLLDMGCGPGPGSSLATTGVDYLGIDVEAGYIEYARRRHERAGVRFQHCDIHAVQETFTKAVVFSVLHHLTDEEVVAVGRRLREIVSGRVCFVEPNPEESRGIQRFLLDHDRGQYVRKIEDHLKLLQDSYSVRTILSRDTPRLRLVRFTYCLGEPRP